MKYVVTALVLCAALCACATGETAPLYAGTAKVDISPDHAVVSADGMSFRLPDVIPSGEKTPPNNIHDPLYARVVVLKNRDVSLAIVSVDLVLFSSKRVVDEARKQWGIDHVILSATHTHSGMVPREMCPTDDGWGWCLGQDDTETTLDWDGLSEDPWQGPAEEKMIAAIGEAAQNLFPARLTAGKGPYESVYLGHNRRVVDGNGRVRMMWDNPRRIPTKPRDSTVGVIRIDDDTGKPRAVMVHYACHPVTMMGDAKITADFPGAMADYIEEQLGPDCMAMFLNGASGDIDPYEISLRGEYGYNMVRQSGIALGKAALRVAGDLTPPAKPEASVRIEENMIKAPQRHPNKFSDVCITSVVIDDNLALVTMPGEIFIQHQLNLTEKSPVPNTFLLGLAYCGKGSRMIHYVPTAQAFRQGGYGAAQASFVAGDAGDIMVNAAVDSIEELTAK